MQREVRRRGVKATAARMVSACFERPTQPLVPDGVGGSVVADYIEAACAMCVLRMCGKLVLCGEDQFGLLADGDRGGGVTVAGAFEIGRAHV